MKKYLALKASAGSGKTFALTVRYITLLLKGANPKEILTLTFTNKAANEMSERIYNTLLSLGEDKAYLSAIITQSGFSEEKIFEKKDYLIDLFSNATLSIFTIDKFINKILREFSGYAGVNDDFEIKEDDIEKISSKFLKSLDLENFDKLIDFSLFENKKYNSLFEIFKNIFEKGEDIETVNIDLSLIELQKKEALDEALKIKEFILSCEVASNSAKKAVDYENFEELISKKWLEKESAQDYSYFKKCSNDLLEKYFQKTKEEVGNYYKLRSAFSLSRLFELYKLFKAYKRRYNSSKNYLHFDDISNICYELLSSKIDKEFLYFRLDSNFSHILIDEFQDTSLLQYKILKPLIEEILSSTDFKTFFYVGDTKQSIYRFRGGKRELFDYVLKTNDMINVEVLNTNYRSCEEVVNFVNKSFNSLPFYEYYDQLAIHQDGYVEVYEDEALLDDDKFVNLAKKISELMQKGVNSNDIAILTYTNDDVLNIYSYLKRMFPSLKISTEMTSKLINQENVKAVINAIKYLYFKEDIYKENLNAIIGKEPKSSFEYETDLKYKSVQEVILKIADYLEITDDNIIKFIELASSYKNIVDFIYEVDNLDASIENSEKIGLQILTIFKSKGLEFHTVLLLDRVKQKVPNRNSLLFEYDDVNLKNIYYKIGGLDNYSQEYKEALQKEKTLEFEDELNILYVALTRARKNMIVFKKKEKSVFDLLSLKEFSSGEIIASENKSKNYEKTKKVVYIPKQIGKQEKPLNIQDNNETYTLHAKYFGIATHYCLEMMNEFDENSLLLAINLVENRFSIYLNKEDIQKIKTRVSKLVSNEEFISLIQNGTFSKEQSLFYKDELKIIDLLVEKDGKYYIFDYKTTKDELQEHIEQVNFYKEAIKSIVSSDEVYSYIIYLNENNIKLKKV
ncbi:recombinase RecB [Halarcobacter mediterraneus]|uniref:DNA 3'-5' helicase n=1 Tax=Halarcobacter mediterraneus TaxID=2023153 RepID=A0A4Q1B3C3_9BACT|nr:RecB-like helicase [Halarcobacter mediterraneus]RXK13315.1 recombinase RecB [Halarcobacter mediterraneus]